MNYLAAECWGNCRVCGEHQDLRLGACFTCADKVSGRDLGGGKHQLWETAKPDNRWVASFCALTDDELAMELEVRA